MKHMTLAEWCGLLPDHHAVNVELATLRAAEKRATDAVAMETTLRVEVDLTRLILNSGGFLSAEDRGWNNTTRLKYKRARATTDAATIPRGRIATMLGPPDAVGERPRFGRSIPPLPTRATP